jgi:hypothetical protein
MAVWVNFLEGMVKKFFESRVQTTSPARLGKFLTMASKKFLTQKAMVKGGQTDLRNDRSKKVKSTALGASILAKRRKSSNRSGLRIQKDFTRHVGVGRHWTYEKKIIERKKK